MDERLGDVRGFEYRLQQGRVGAVLDALLTGVGLGLSAAFVVMVLAALLVRTGL